MCEWPVAQPIEQFITVCCFENFLQRLETITVPDLRCCERQQVQVMVAQNGDNRVAQRFSEVF